MVRTGVRKYSPGKREGTGRGVSVKIKEERVSV